MKLQDLTPGKEYAYYTGKCLASSSFCQERNAVFEMYQRDEVELTQRRLVNGEFEYLVTRNRLPYRPEVIKKRREYTDRMLAGDTSRLSRHER